MHPHVSRCLTPFGLLASLALAAWPALAQVAPLTSPAQPTQHPQTAPATQPAAYANKMFPLDAKVQEVLDKARQAYAGLRAYQDLGSATTTMTVLGKTQEVTNGAATTYEKPSKFVASHEAANLYCDGQTLWIYMATRGRCYQSPVSEALGPTGPAGLQAILRSLPVLSMLLQPGKSLLATNEAYQSQYRGQEKLGDRAVQHISLVVPATAWFGPAGDQPANPGKVLMDVYFDATTFMVLRLNLNMTEAMKNYYTNIQSPARTTELEQVAWQFNAGHIRLNVPIPADTFAFKVPAEAEQVDTFAALTSNAPARQPVNDEEEAERAEVEQARLPFAAPDFALPDLAGKDIKLSDYRGKVVLVDFWATWCGPCRVVLPGIQKLHADLVDKGLQVLAIDIGEDAQRALEFAEKNKMTIKVLLDEQDKISQQYKVTAIPKSFLIDQKGQVVKVFTGLMPEATIREAIMDLLGASAASQPGATQPNTRNNAEPATGRTSEAVATRPTE